MSGSTSIDTNGAPLAGGEAPPAPDVEAIVAELRADVQRKRAAGAYPADLLERLRTEFHPDEDVYKRQPWYPRAGRALRSETDQRNVTPLAEGLGSTEPGQLDEERDPDDLAAQPLDQLGRRAGSPPGRQQIVDDEHPLAGADGVGVDLEHRLAVLQGVGDRDGLGRQLALLADRDEADPEQVGQSPAEDEASGLHPDDHLDPGIAIGVDQPVDGGEMCIRDRP